MLGGMDLEGVIGRMKAEARRRLAKAAAHLATAAKVTVSVPAPRKTSKRTGRPYATTRATPGAPPRKLSGAGRASIAWVVSPDGRTAIVGTNKRYMGRHETAGHPWLLVTLDRERPAIDRILRGAAP